MRRPLFRSALAAGLLLSAACAATFVVLKARLTSFSNPAADHTGRASTSSRPTPPVASPLGGLKGASGLQLAQSYGKIPLHFERNEGQTDGQVAFLARGVGYTLFLTDAGEAVLSLRRGETPRKTSPDSPTKDVTTKGLSSKASVLRQKLLGANPNTRAQSVDALPGKSNYLIGNDPSRWRRMSPSLSGFTTNRSIPASTLLTAATKRRSTTTGSSLPAPTQGRFLWASKGRV